MAELPTEEDLEKLYQEKGHDALVWYAWRNTQRALPLLGELPTEQIWGEDTVRHVFAICSVPLVLAQWVDVSTQISSRVADYSAKIRAAVIATARGKAARNARAAVRSAVVASSAIRTVANDSMSIRHVHTAASVVADKETRVTANTDISAPYTYATICAAITADYELLAQRNSLFPEFWDSQLLWLQGEPPQMAKWRQSFDFDLRKLGLSFLVDDLNHLWEGKPLGTHVQNYLKKFSEVDLNDPDALRRLILEEETAENVHAVRVLLLGPGGAGKSSLADRLLGKSVEPIKKLTVGVDYLNHRPLNLYDKFDYVQQGDKPLSLYLWDFGGQTIFHGLHSAFLHENCVYVLVVDSRHEQAPDEWLHQIMHLAGGRANVLLVTNWYERCETRQNEARLLREFPDLLDEGSFFYFSCHEPDACGFKNFVRTLEKACLDSQHMVLKETLDVNEALQQQYQDNVFLESADLEEIIERVTNRPKSIETLPNKLEQLGFLVRVDSDDQHYCLKPAWVVDNAYAVLYSPLLRESKGVLKLKTLQREFNGQIEASHMAYLVEFLQMRSLCRKLARGNGYFFPDAAPADELPEVSELLREKAKGLVIRFDLPYLPLGFHAALVHRLSVPGGIRKLNDIWRQGFILHKNHSRTVVHYLTRKSVVELVLAGEWQDFAELLNIVLTNLKAVLLGGKDISEKQIIPSVVFDRDVFSVHSAEQLVQVLRNIRSYDQIFDEVKRMAAKQVNETHYHGDVTHNTGGDASNFATNSEHFTQNSHIQTIDVTTDQRQQIAAIIGSLLKDAGSLDPESLMAVAEVNKALAAPQDKPEARNLLGKVWSGLKDTLSTVKTGTDIAEFALKHQAEIVGAITTAVALLK
ncbi:COR domain-containing protein [Candidatus Thiothrix anitrata]|uniref:COR domain-containing protein n=1 Tax=Candidatus Thiothrix anitrata TaxID=2823902 RepID=A0ABX7WYK8_9GAMM|nr:COR domain-containing protein [Candidatus Thiothrix anitrata]QTR48769.1 hypothetical protein J8380_10755 [Candidatus Thiothrix anitrata]